MICRKVIHAWPGRSGFETTQKDNMIDIKFKGAIYLVMLASFSFSCNKDM